jgi:hypothetical protein
MRIVKKIILLLLVVLIIMQFFHPTKNLASAKSANHISTVYIVPANVSGILNKACNDCHSNNTRYPWYNNIQPVAWWLNNHIEEGKKELNFDEFKTYRPAKQFHKLEKVIDEVKKGGMPLTSYTIIHTDAKLTDQEKSSLVTWAESVRNVMKEKYPADSLVQKKNLKKNL